MSLNIHLKNMIKKNDDTNETVTKKKKTNRQYTVVMYVFFFMFLCLMGYFLYFQIVLSEKYVNCPYNSLQNIVAERVDKGKILTSDGKVLAETQILSNGERRRVYPYDNLFAHVVGFNSHGKSGLEGKENTKLTKTHDIMFNQLYNEVTQKKNKGDNIVTTLDYDVQKLAYDGLGNYDGSVIVMQPSTGKILAVVSKPDFNPNLIDEQWKNLVESSDSVLYNRATQGKYTPGSVFKIFTTLEYYNENKMSYNEFKYRCRGGEAASNGYILHDAGNERHGLVNLKSAFAESCNSAYANIAKGLDAKKFSSFCNKMLFGKDLPLNLETSKSKFLFKSTDSDFIKMSTGIGQGKTLVSPLHMVLVASAIDNNGVLMKPYLVDKVQNPSGDVVTENKPQSYKKLLDIDQAELMQNYMQEVVKSGTATRLRGQSYQCFGKTGTAQIADSVDTTNAWFVGYGKKEGYEDIAVAVVVEKSGYGSKYAIPVAKKIFDKYFNTKN
ncbi:peptidoglycan D,D-transpeptidase FtsI family protein [Lachnobacterium bovis]|uniref:Peptidoglycan glycosyltransferase n=1 Tax=Lachnobacterium bovis TaxID=140626 RepID=A0A1H9QNB6_9FIRM|nr:penicillin-binding transpeptidase domain-containing protein [Lachnobacterium bovis]SER61952.1 peptidoglycan glycosyltransferase [Lachnobacterium bovis]